MCGRFTLIADGAAVAEWFDLAAAPDLSSRYNVAPTQQIFALRLDADGKREGAFLRWGLIPTWAKDPSIAFKLINARSETVATKPAFRSAFRKRRCLVAADGFYEWRAEGRRKQPFLFRRPDHGLFAIAGLWESWIDADERPVETCTLITTNANAVVRPVHDRMPVLLPRTALDHWLDRDSTADEIQAMLQPAPDDFITATPVRDWVNTAKNEGPRCIEPIEQTLFGS